MSGKTYWERLGSLRLYSLHRRRERYLILYCFKVIHNLVPDCGLVFHENSRTGIHIAMPSLKTNQPSFVKKFLGSKFSSQAPPLYNILPTDFRRMFDNVPNPLASFKKRLGTFLERIPDQPTIPGPQRAAASNSIIDQFNYMTK